MTDLLAARLPPKAPIPLTWVTANAESRYLNLGDALSAVMVAGLAMRPVAHRALASEKPILRMAAVGTIGHSLSGGEIVVWGSGTSSYSNPFAGPDRVLYTTPPDTRLIVTATRGPISRRILGEGNAVGPPAYGDPVWLLPRMFAPAIEKKYELGIIPHLSDLTGRTVDAVPKPDMRRYAIPESLKDSVTLIHTITEISLDALRQRLELILSCKRIVSTSLHGMIIAETYSIPCLYFSPRGGTAGLQVSGLGETEIDLRVADFYQGVNKASLPIWIQPRAAMADWEEVCRTIDREWAPVDRYDDRPLIEAFPLPVLGLDREKDLFARPAVQSIPFDPSRSGPRSRLARIVGALRRAGGR